MRTGALGFATGHSFEPASLSRLMTSAKRKYMSSRDLLGCVAAHHAPGPGFAHVPCSSTRFSLSRKPALAVTRSRFFDVHESQLTWLWRMVTRSRMTPHPHLAVDRFMSSPSPRAHSAHRR